MNVSGAEPDSFRAGFAVAFTTEEAAQYEASSRGWLR